MPRSVSRKKYQKRYSRPQHKASLGIMALGLVLSLILLGKLISVVLNLGQPFAPDKGFTPAKKYSWNGQSTVNIVVKSANIYTLSFNPVEKSVVVIKMPDETYVDVPFNFGRWPVRSLYRLGQDEKLPMGAYLLKETMSSVFGVPIAGYILFSGNFATLPLDTVIEKIHQSPLSALALVRESKTDLSLPEFLQFVWQIKGVRSDRVKVVDLGQSKITQWALLPDSSRVLGIEQIRLDQFVQNQFEDNRLRDGGVTIGIFNATEHPGLAEKAARIVTNMGGRVIFTSTSQTLSSKSLVLGKNSYTLTRLSEIFAPDCISKNCLAQNANQELSRADVNVILGEDYYLGTNKKP